MNHRVRCYKRPGMLLAALAVLGLAACEGSVDLGDFATADPPPPPPPGSDTNVSSNLEVGDATINPDGSFVLGAPPATAKFEGGMLADVGTPDLARSGTGAWMIDEGGVGTITFSSPAKRVELWFRNENDAAAQALKNAGAGLRKQDCGVTDVGNDPAEAFGFTMFVRGSFNDWTMNPGPPQNFVNLGNNIYQAEFDMTAGDVSYKIASAGWEVERAFIDGDTTVGSPVTMTDPGPGGPNGSISLTEDGCYNWRMDASNTDEPVLTVTKVEPGNGGEPVGPAASTVRVLDETGAEIASVDGTAAFQQVLIEREKQDTLISRIEVLNSVSPESQALAKAGVGVELFKQDCGVEDVGNDPAEAFGFTMFVRGSFNDWTMNPGPPQNFVNLGNNIYQAEFDMTAGDVSYKIASAGWEVERAFIDGDTTLGSPVTMTDPGPGGPNGSISLTEDGCYNWQMDASNTDEPVLTVTKVEPDDGGGGGGGGEGGIGMVAVDDFSFVADSVLTLFYTRPDSDYSGTTIEITSSDGTFTETCVPTTDSAFGCFVRIPITPGITFTYTVFNNGVADDSGPITVDLADLDGNALYSFAGGNLPVLSQLPALPNDDPSIPGLDEVILFYKRPDNSYVGWGLHLFPITSPDWTFFTGGEYFPEGIDDDFGAYFRIGLPQNVSPPYSANPPPLDAFPESLGFIIHRGEEKDPGPDQFIRIAEDGNVVFVVSGVNEVSTTPPGPVQIAGAAAHWVATDLLLWSPGEGAEGVELYHSASIDIEFDGKDIVGADGMLSLDAGANPGFDNARHLNDLDAWNVPEADAADLVGQQLVAVAVNADGDPIKATTVQIPLVLDDLYAQAAAGATLGVAYEGSIPTLAVWAPTANSVSVNLYDNADDESPSAMEDLDFDPATGIWSVTGSADWDRKYYTYTVNVFAPSVGAVVDNEVTDPYSVSLSTGSSPGRRVKSQIVNLDDADLKPAGWDELAKPALDAPEDIVLYELHVRDFSVWDATVPEADRGKYTAFAAAGSDGVNHLQALADAGLTHVHILPSFDIATVNENAAERVELTTEITQELCDAGSLGANCESYIGQTVEEVLASFPADSDEQQAIVDLIDGLDGFNWGYDPFHYSTPEGSYASDPDGTARILEFRTMVKGLANIGLRAVMDVVYNHTNASLQGDKSVLDKVVPGYYHRLNQDSGTVLRDSCCDDTASEHAMMEKLIVDSTAMWVAHYKIDGFRFDIMGFHPLSTMQKVRDAVQAIDPQAYVYGEGWNFGDVVNDRRFLQATQRNLAGTGIGSFNDRSRDGVRGGGPFDGGISHVRTQGFISGQFYDPNAENDGDDTERENLLDAADWIRLGMAGNLAEYQLEDREGNVVPGAGIDYKGQDAGYTGDPQEIINYVASHDNETLWDISQYKHPVSTTTADRVRAHNVGNAIVLLGQGVPFLHAGQDILRSKSMDRNSFDSGDWFNRLDFTLSDNNFAVGEPLARENQSSLTQIRDVLAIPEADPAMADIAFAHQHVLEMLEVRKSSSLFRLRTAEQVQDRVEFHNTGPDQTPGLIMMSIDGCISADLTPEYGAIVVGINASNSDHTFPLFGTSTFTLHPVLQGSVDPVVQTAAHDANGFFVPARTAAVFTSAEQSDCPEADPGPFGVDIFVRGTMNDWADPPPANDQLVHLGDGIYEVTLNLDAIAHSFKVADAGWTAESNCGSPGGESAILGEPFTMVCAGDSQNIGLDLTAEPAGNYLFRVDASDLAAPTVTVEKLPFEADIFVRGTMNDWADPPPASDQLAFVGGGVYRVTLDLDAIAHSFKIADPGWTAESNCGSPGGESAMLGVPFAMVCAGDSQNIGLDLTAEPAGEYLFTVDASDLGAPTVTVESPPFAADIFVRGTMNDWADPPPADAELIFVGGGFYEATLSLDAIAHSFKIADPGWTAETNCGSPGGESAMLGVPFAMVCAGDSQNIGLDLTAEPAGDYVFRVDANDTMNPTVEVSAE